LNSPRLNGASPFTNASNPEADAPDLDTEKEESFSWRQFRTPAITRHQKYETNWDQTIGTESREPYGGV